MIITRRFLAPAARPPAPPLLWGGPGAGGGSRPPAIAADTLNVYSIWPENWARPMFEEFEKATGIKVNFVRFSSGEALARVIAEKNNPAVDVLFGGPVETFAAGINEGLFEPYKPPSFAALPARFRHADGQWIAIADDPLVFMTNDKFLKENGLKAPASWDDLLEPGLQEHAADGRCAHLGHGRHAHLLRARGQRPRREQGLRLHEEAAAQRAALYQERRRRHAAGRPGPGGRRHLLHRRRAGYQGQGLRRRRSAFPEGRHRHLGRGDRADQGRQESRGRQEADRFRDQPGDAVQARRSTRSTSCRPIPR